MQLEQADKIARSLCERLRPHCEPALIKIAGSVRRRKLDVHDIEVVCVPKATIAEQGDIFGEVQRTGVRDPAFADTLLAFGTLRKGNPYTGRMITLEHSTGIAIEVYTAVPATFGYILLIRTGPKEFSARMMKRAKNLGYTPADGMLSNGIHPVEVKSEERFFELLGIPFQEPRVRC